MAEMENGQFSVNFQRKHFQIFLTTQNIEVIT